jgi:hypothetical protein
MFHFILAVVAAAAGLAEIHSDMLADFEIALNIFADFNNGAGGFMAEDFDTGAHRGNGQGAADSAGRERRADRAFENLGVAAADTGIGYFYFNLIRFTDRFGNILYF